MPEGEATGSETAPDYNTGKRIDNGSTVLMGCEVCGQEWSPNIRPGGRMPRGYRRCPNGCVIPRGFWKPKRWIRFAPGRFTRIGGPPL